MEPWRRTILALFVVHLITSAGFSLALPFLPLYVKQLGVESAGAVAFWSGLIFALPAAAMMIASPLWGWVADRYGRKVMLVRSTVAGAVILALMGVVQDVTQLAVLRVLQGLLTGFIAASNALVAATVPKARAGESFGLLKTAAWVGTGLGPLLGGLFADALGFRAAFWVTGGLLALGGLLVIFLVREDFEPQDPTVRRGFFAVYALILRSAGLRRVYALSFLDSFARAILLPVIPLYILALSASPQGVASVTGVLLGLRAFAGAISAYFMGRLGDRLGHGRVVVISGLLMVLLYLPQPFINASWQLVVLQLLVGVVGAGILPGIAALVGLHMPQGNAGAAFGMDSSVQNLARSVGPLFGAAVAAWVSLPGAFASIIGIYVLLVIIALPIRGTKKP